MDNTFLELWEDTSEYVSSWVSDMVRYMGQGGSCGKIIWQREEEEEKRCK